MYQTHGSFHRLCGTSATSLVLVVGRWAGSPQPLPCRRFTRQPGSPSVGGALDPSVGRDEDRAGSEPPQ